MSDAPPQGNRPLLNEGVALTIYEIDVGDLEDNIEDLDELYEQVTGQSFIVPPRARGAEEMIEEIRLKLRL